MKKSMAVSALLSFALVLLLAAVAAGDQKILSRWSQKQKFVDDMGAELEVQVTYYSAEYVQALVQEEAQKNLWTADETEQYKYQLLKSLNLDEYIPIHVAFDNRGSPMHLAPFDKLLTLWVGKKKLAPADYDKRFNFRLEGKRDGLISFPRYDEKGKPYLKGVKTVRFSMAPGISTTTMSKASVDFIWDVDRDNPEVLTAGKAAARLELDRLIKRIEKLNAEKKDLEDKLSAVDSELSTINKRVEELQKQ